MRGALSIFVGAVTLFALVGCSGGTPAPDLRNKDSDNPTGGGAAAAPANNSSTNTQPASTQTPAQIACAAAAPATMLSDRKDAKDIRIAGKAVFFTSGTDVIRATKDGVSKKTVYTSPNLVRAFVDTTSLITLEASADAPDATTVRIVTANPTALDPNAAPADPPVLLSTDFPEFPVAVDGTQLGTTAATNFNAAGSQVFATDDTSFFVLADTAAGSSIVRFDKTTLAQTVLVTTANTIKNPQIASSAVWYVLDEQRVFKVALPDDDTPIGDPTEVFGVSYSNVDLAVDETAAFITTGEQIERRDLTGGNPTTIFDATKSKMPLALGNALSNKGSLYVASEQADPTLQHVIRAIPIAGGDERFVSCGRTLVSGMNMDTTSIVWTEDAGVFITSL